MKNEAKPRNTRSTPPDLPEKEVSCNILIMREYIKRYVPVDTYAPGTEIFTTADIISALADMADISPDEVNAVMFENGFRLGRNTVGSFGWMMQS